MIKLERNLQKTIFEDEPVSDDVKQRELMEILVDEKNAEIVRLYEQLKAKDEQLAKKDEQLRVKDVQIAEKDKQLDQQQQLTLQAMNDRDTLKLELEQANEKFKSKKAKVSGHAFSVDNPGLDPTSPFSFLPQEISHESIRRLYRLWSRI